MCLTRITKCTRKSPNWAVAYKVLKELPKNGFEVPFYYHRTYPSQRGQVITDSTIGYLLTPSGQEYECGFHCHRRRKDAEERRTRMESSNDYRVCRVFTRHIVATGRDSLQRPIVVAKELYVPTKRGDRPCASA